jgi:hypothetical protein
MHRWRSLVERSKQYNESGIEIARLRNEVCNLKAQLHDLTNKEEVSAHLAAERSMNRCGLSLQLIGFHPVKNHILSVLWCAESLQR